ncbi:hypothetical protein M413DRAFT_326267 [Hebeloma cylindrosporum]|uniref:Uncharacterized protein n=1 Tax=Hebeloma cylindrosporum TaxID=76867 RepID=A0A0C3BWM2_HEBCY|nr:hypothetical protein M413DRAFT_326267 [Hebeloma cylindrosporum h7]
MIPVELHSSVTYSGAKSRRESPVLGGGWWKSGRGRGDMSGNTRVSHGPRRHVQLVTQSRNTTQHTCGGWPSVVPAFTMELRYPTDLSDTRSSRCKSMTARFFRLTTL